MTLRQYLSFVNKYRLILLTGLLAGVGLGMYTVQSSEPTYRGSVTYFVNSVGEGTIASANAGDQFAQRRVNSYLALLRTDRLAQMIIDDTGLEAPPPAVRNRLSGSADLDTVLLTARVNGIDRERVALITDSLTRTFPELVSEVERTGDGEPTVRIEVVSGPSVVAIGVRTKLILATTAIVGALIALAIATIRELFDSRLHSVDRAVALSGVPLLGVVTTDRHAPKRPLTLGDGVGSLRSEEYRHIRTSVQFANGERATNVIVVTSSVPSEGKSLTAVNLAISFARSGRRVAIVDADLRRPKVGSLLGLEQSVGLSEILRRRASLDDVLQWWGESDLAVLAAGGSTSNPSELLGTRAMTQLITDLRGRFDTVIIDSPPLVPVTDAAVVAALADGVVLMVRPDRVTKAQFLRALSNLDRVHANLIGIVGSMVAGRSNPYASAYTNTKPVEFEPIENDGTFRSTSNEGNGSDQLSHGGAAGRDRATQM